MKYAIVMSSLMITFFAAAQPAKYKGNVKIELYGIICIQQTADDPFGFDGVGDEVKPVFVTFDRQNFSKNIRGQIYGDVFGATDDRIQAGSVSVNGGFKTGDVFHTSRWSPIYDGFLGPDEFYDIFIMAPSIWEIDKTPPGKTSPENDFINATLGKLSDPAFIEKMYGYLRNLNYDPSATANYNFQVPGRYIGLDDIYKGIFRSTINDNLCSRPIGMLPEGEFSSTAFILNARLAKVLAAQNFGYGAGIVPIYFSDVSLGNTKNHGAYTILVKITANIETVLGPKRPVTLNPGPATNIELTNEYLYGGWKGTRGLSGNSSGEEFSFKFNNNTFWVLNRDGTSFAATGYTVTADKKFLTATYNLPAGGTCTIQAQSVSNGILYGSWSTSGSANNQNGLWIANKYSN